MSSFLHPQLASLKLSWEKTFITEIIWATKSAINYSSDYRLIHFYADTNHCRLLSDQTHIVASSIHSLVINRTFRSSDLHELHVVCTT